MLNLVVVNVTIAGVVIVALRDITGVAPLLSGVDVTLSVVIVA